MRLRTFKAEAKCQEQGALTVDHDHTEQMRTAECEQLSQGDSFWGLASIECATDDTAAGDDRNRRERERQPAISMDDTPQDLTVKENTVPETQHSYLQVSKLFNV